MATTRIKNGFEGGTDDQLLVNPDGSINVNTTGTGGNASVGANGATAPTSSTQIAAVDPDGNLVPLEATADGRLRVDTTTTVVGTVSTQEAGLNSFQTSQYVVGTTTSQLTPTPLPNRSSISLRVNADNGVAVYIGNNGAVTTMNGYPLYNGDTLQMDLTPTGLIYAVSTDPGQVVAVLEIA